MIPVLYFRLGSAWGTSKFCEFSAASYSTELQTAARGAKLQTTARGTKLLQTLHDVHASFVRRYTEPDAGVL